MQEIRLKKSFYGQACLIETIAGDRTLFGELLTKPEQRWIVAELQDFLKVLHQKTEQYKQWLQQSAQNQQLNALSHLVEQGVGHYKAEQLELAKSLFAAATILDVSCAEAHKQFRGSYKFFQKDYSRRRSPPSKTHSVMLLDTGQHAGI
ncbi:hypothetical protein HC928_21970 [bacterium]|nr:hypothetical protein [bacterium]